MTAASPGQEPRRARLRLVAPAVATAVVQVAGSRAMSFALALDLRPFGAHVPLLLAGPAALLVRRRHPHVAQVVAGLAVLVWAALTGVTGPVWVSPAVAAVSAVAGSAPGHEGGRRRATAYVLLAATWALSWLFAPGPWSAVAGSLAWLLVVVAVAEGLRARRAAAADRRRQAEQEALAREEERRRRAADERLAVARELHDVIGHSLSMISVQSGVALELMDARPEVAREALTAIRAASRDALVEVHGVLASLRGADPEGASEGTSGSPPRAPAPSMADLDALLARPRAAGLRVDASGEGDLTGLPVAVDLAAARIVQEALTNVARHAGGSAARVLLRRADQALVVVVDDDGSPSPSAPPSGGSGLPGMRERAAALGGRLAAGPRERGGWRVEAELPLARPAPEEGGRP